MPRLTFVWPYWHDGAHYDELRWSMRSVVSMFRGEASCVIVGDRPPWYGGQMIEMPRTTQARGFTPGLGDALRKWQRALTELHDDQLVWMMDDVFFLQPFSIEDLAKPRPLGTIKLGKSHAGGFRGRLAATGDALAAKGYPVRNFASHVPHLVDRRRALGLFAEFQIVENKLLWEVVYRNVTAGQVFASGPWFKWTGKQLSDAQLEHVVSKSTVCLSTGGRAWNEPLRRWLYHNLPAQPDFEIQAPKPPLPASDAMQPVKSAVVAPKSSKRPGAKSEARYTPWGDGWTCWNGKAAECEFVDLVVALIKIQRPAIAIETGIGRGYTSRPMSAAMKTIPDSLFVGYESDDAFRSKSGICGCMISKLATPTAEQIASADLLVFDSETPLRMQEIELWHIHGKPGSMMIVHDVSPRHPEGRIHRQLLSKTEQLGIQGIQLGNPRGGFVATKPGYSAPGSRKVFTRDMLFMP